MAAKDKPVSQLLDSVIADAKRRGMGTECIGVTSQAMSALLIEKGLTKSSINRVRHRGVLIQVSIPRRKKT